MTSNEYLFDCGRDALYFAFRYCDQQYAKAPELQKGRIIGSGKGLISMDGAGQAGMIHREIRRLGDLHHYALLARFGEHIQNCSVCGSPSAAKYWVAACKYIAEQMRKDVAPDAHIRLMELLVERHFSYQKVTLEAISRQFGDGLDKVKKLNAKLSPALKAVEARAQQRIEDKLIELCLVVSDKAVSNG